MFKENKIILAVLTPVGLCIQPSCSSVGAPPNTELNNNRNAETISTFHFLPDSADCFDFLLLLVRHF